MEEGGFEYQAEDGGRAEFLHLSLQPNKTFKLNGFCFNLNVSTFTKCGRKAETRKIPEGDTEEFVTFRIHSGAATDLVSYNAPSKYL